MQWFKNLKINHCNIKITICFSVSFATLKYKKSNNINPFKDRWGMGWKFIIRKHDMVGWWINEIVGF